LKFHTLCTLSMVILKCTIVPTTYPFMDYTKMYQAPEKYTF
jgi:hypothetical protein